MSLTDFIQISKFRSGANKTGYVDIKLASGEKSTLTVNECYSEFDAKERAYLYLVDRIYNKTDWF